MLRKGLSVPGECKSVLCKGLSVPGECRSVLSKGLSVPGECKSVLSKGLQCQTSGVQCCQPITLVTWATEGLAVRSVL